MWASALTEVRYYATAGVHDTWRGSEGLVYFAGVPTIDTLIVTAVFRLHHAPQGDRVMPTQAEVRWLLSTLRERDEKLVAQLHTHRHGARHSPGDNEMATSFHDGFLSIVAPNFAVGVDRIDQCIVHEYRNGAFRALPEDETAERFTIHAQLVDHPQYHAAEETSRWRKFVQSLKRIARKRR